MKWVPLSLMMAASLAVMAPLNASATLLFQDNFDTDTASTTLNFTGFTNWDVSSGTVDYIKSGSYGISCYDSSSGCTDLDGSTGLAGRMTTKSSFSFLQGDSYSLSFWLSGNQRGGQADNLDYGIEGGSYTGSLLNIAANAPFNLYTLSFTAASNFSGKIFFDAQGGDNIGPILDNVSLSQKSDVAVPEPGALTLLGLGLVALSLSRQRRLK